MPRKVSRRRILRTSGAASVAALSALAGCAQDGDGDGDGGDGAQDGEPAGDGEDVANETGDGEDGANETGDGAQTEEQEMITMDVATAFALGMSDTHPIMQETFRQNIEDEVGDRINVQMHPAGELGKGAELPEKTQEGTVEGSLHSISNWIPFAPATDFVNMPYFFGATDYETITQRYFNLVTSDVWDEVVHPKVAERNFVPHAYISAGTRVLGLGNGWGGPEVRLPEDVQGAKIRVSPSDTIAKSLELIGVNPTSVGWGETPQAVEEGVVDGLHVAIGSIHANLPDLLDHLTFINMAQSAFVYDLNREWYEGLPSDVQDGLDRAGKKTQEANIEQVPVAIENAKDSLAQENDVGIVELESSELETWKETAGVQLSTWDQKKAELSGDRDFEEFIQASRNEG